MRGGTLRRWTAEEDEKLETLYNEYGYSISYIAEELDRSTGGVHARLERLRWGRTNAPDRVKESNQYKTSGRASNHNTRWTDEEMDFVAETMHEEPVDVAYVLGRTLYAVCERRSKLIRERASKERKSS